MSETAVLGETEPGDEIDEQKDAGGPRIRWAAIIWGLVIAAFAAWGLWISADAGRFGALDVKITAAVMAGDPAAVAVIGVLAVGALVLVTGLVGLARRLQRGPAA